jgi:uncharacterized protein (DUF2147 family)
MRLFTLTAMVACTLLGTGAASADPKGMWMAQDGAHVQVRPCGSALCAVIAAPKSAYDPETGRPGRWSGQLYNVDNGNVYTGHLLELGPTTIRVEGCAIGICGGQNMTRIK